ncbi:Unknown protein, partial [Striga hermonthica]
VRTLIYIGWDCDFQSLIELKKLFALTYFVHKKPLNSLAKKSKKLSSSSLNFASRCLPHRRRGYGSPSPLIACSSLCPLGRLWLLQEIRAGMSAPTLAAGNSTINVGELLRQRLG